MRPRPWDVEGSAAPEARLSTLLSRTAPGTLISVVAGAGYGKSTLLETWLATSPIRSTVISLDARDNDPDEFGRYVVERISRVVPAVEPLRTAAMSSRPDWAQIFADLRAPLAHAPVIVMFDDVQVLTSDEARAVLATFVKERLNHGIVVLAGRSLPRLGIRANRVPITSRQLRLLPRDVLIAAHGSISWETAQRICEATWGWPAGVQVSLALYRGGQVDLEKLHGGQLAERINQYLEDEVLLALSGDELAVLMAAATAGALPRADLEHLLPDVDLDAVIDAIAAHDIPLLNVQPDADQVFSFHSILREAIDEMYRRRHPEARRELLLRLVAHLVEQGRDREAFQRVVDVGHPDVVSAFIAQRGLHQAMRGHAAPVRHWLEHVPAATIMASPQLLFVKAIAYAADCDYVAMEHCLTMCLRASLAGTGDDDVTTHANALMEIAGLQPLGTGIARAASLAGPMGALSQILIAVGQGSSGQSEAAEATLAACEAEVQRYPLLYILHASTLAVTYGHTERYADMAALVGRARRVVERHALHESPMSMAVDIPEAWLYAHTNQPEKSLAAMERSRRKLARVTDGMRLGKLCWLSFLAEAAVRLDEIDIADELLTEANRLFADEPRAVAVGSSLSEIREYIDSRRARTGTMLTSAELSVLRQLASHLRAQQIAEALGVSVTTVRTHIRGIYGKLGTHDRTASVAEARRRGLIAD